MNKQSKLLFIGAFLCYVCGHTQSIGPATINSAGGSAVIASNAYEWSVAEMTLVSTAQAGSIIVTQGLLQPNYGTAGVNENEFSFGLFLVYPIPTYQMLMLEPHLETGGKLQWVLYDTWGKELRRQRVQLQSGNETQTLDLSALPAANYFLHLHFESASGTKQAAYTIQKL